DDYDGEKSWLVMVLQDVQESYNYLPAAALQRVAERLGLGLPHVYNVATFYSSFSLVERGRHLIRLCDGTACHLRGGPALRDEIKRQLGIDAGETTEDRMFTLDVVACLGACALAPVITIDSKYYGRMTPRSIKPTLDYHRQLEQVDT
ncbi:unnamed protein product, partial [marine sediment metagenome]